MRSIVLLIALCTAAQAQPSLIPPSQPGESQLMPPGETPPVDDMIPGEASYRLQTILVDLSAIALTAAAFETNEAVVGTAGLVTFALGAPAIHALHGKGARGALSLGMRVVLPLTTGYLLSQAWDDDDHGALVGMVFGFGIGAGVAMVIDSAVLARGTPSRRRSVTPVVRTTTGGAIVGISGAF